MVGSLSSNNKVEKKKLKSSQKSSEDVVDFFKKKVIELGTDYVKNNINISKEDVANYVQKQLEKKFEKKIKREVKRHVVIYLAYLMIVLALVFLSYSLFEVIVYVLELPLFVTNILFGIFLLSLGALLYFYIS